MGGWDIVVRGREQGTAARVVVTSALAEELGLATSGALFLYACEMVDKYGTVVKADASPR